ncbi:oxidoreductase [Flavobacterium sp. K5-23]|uniref:sialidase family protein n=1 Tax=Flavobacterium sp. K5-23 TaxID=2746225 RepID=UPI00200D22A6|nr:oxidoreductase [Flavobacterium sp. K5-23]UQD56551.1 oxidoreductase [Flavobacterium sp. K5-23]
MKNIFLVIIASSVFLSCKTARDSVVYNESAAFESVQVDTLFQDKISIRALVVDADKVWYAANNSRFGYFDLVKNKKVENNSIKDTLKREFRSIAQTQEYIFILNVSNPALLYKVSKKEGTLKLVYQEHHEKVFYDSMQFWNDKEGIAMGDPIGESLSIIITRDGGNSWNRIPSNKLPKVSAGEAAFAASNTNIVLKGNNAWIVSGGVKSRVFYSSDKGKNWEVYNTPIIQGKAMTGIFTADFYDAKNGFIAGGDYEVPIQNFTNKAITKDGGKTWELIGENQGFGYASCIQYVPDSKGKGLVSVGATGLHYSSDSGNSWKQLATDPGFFTIRFINDHTAIAAGHNKMVRIIFK